MKKTLIIILSINFLLMPACAYNLDTSIDDEIRKNYNPSKIEHDTALPVLPKNLQSEVNTIPVNQYQPTQKTQTQTLQPINKQPQYKSKVSVGGNYAVLKKGTKFQTKLVTSVSDRTHRGAAVMLQNRYPVSTTYLTIPIGAIFEGTVVQSHPPQFTGNGGLITMKINSINLNGVSHPASAFVTETNFKHIFFNDIKGQRKFAKNMFSSMRPGFQFYKRMFANSARLLNDGGSAIWSPFPFIAGVVGLGAGVISSPVLAVFSKGGQSYLRSGSNVEIKLEQDVIIYN